MSDTPDRETSGLRVAVAPAGAGPWIPQAVRDGGGLLAAADEAEALIWAGQGPHGLRDTLAGAPQVTWVQLPSAGVENYSRLIGDGRTWTCAKGIYAPPVAEHALALTLAGLHRLPQLARAHSWDRLDYRGLHGGAVTILGGGGIAEALLRFLAPFEVTSTVVRRRPTAISGAARVVGTDDLHDALAGADAVILALALTPETERIIGAPELQAMKSDAWLVNVGRGKLIDTDALVTVLRDGSIGGAALDVTDPEPLPDDHPLWDLDNCLITPHAANPPTFEREHYAALIRDNVRRRSAGEPLQGLIDPSLGY